MTELSASPAEVRRELEEDYPMRSLKEEHSDHLPRIDLPIYRPVLSYSSSYIVPRPSPGNISLSVIRPSNFLLVQLQPILLSSFLGDRPPELLSSRPLDVVAALRLGKNSITSKCLSAKVFSG
ncbi:methionine aminopeptidase 1D, chloroplastic/mitochondrial-like [Dorcoceras hygrometricum]|uniref:Methionine aminopeptidase 1D, chloroplastic/mitochondrial-like n=1 Tax=Dorcoceras hygrometricum TaxID=472368 RepID=A0A2Z7BRD9_9LAMI|nr:methionine aminopeptidase 1D, chloroplastic/mitochondrial-like [Dorcoceras hygrometricum]